MVRAGELGKLRLVQVEYAQDWLAVPTASDNKQSDRRTDPIRSGAGVIGDIGTHAFNLAHFVTAKCHRTLPLTFQAWFRAARWTTTPTS